MFWYLLILNTFGGRGFLMPYLIDTQNFSLQFWEVNVSFQSNQIKTSLKLQLLQ